MSNENNPQVPPNEPPAPGLPAAPPVAPSTSDPLDPLTTMQQELANIRTRLDGLRPTPANPPTPPATPTPAAPVQVTKKALEDQYWQDPIGMTHALATTVAQQTRAEVMATVAPALTEAAKREARAEDPQLFDHLQAHILEKVAKLDPTLLTNPVTWTSAFNLVKGERFQEVTAFMAGRTQARPGGPQQTTPKAPPPPAAPKLTDEETLYARKFGLSAEQYMEGKAMYDNQSEYFGKRK